MYKSPIPDCIININNVINLYHILSSILSAINPWSYFILMLCKNVISQRNIIILHIIFSTTIRIRIISNMYIIILHSLQHIITKFLGFISSVTSALGEVTLTASIFILSAFSGLYWKQYYPWMNLCGKIIYPCSPVELILHPVFVKYPCS